MKAYRIPNADIQEVSSLLIIILNIILLLVLLEKINREILKHPAKKK